MATPTHRKCRGRQLGNAVLQNDDGAPAPRLGGRQGRGKRLPTSMAALTAPLMGTDPPETRRSRPQSFGHHPAFSAGARLLIESAALGDVASVSQSLAKGVDPNVGDYDGRTALHVAATLGQMRVVEALLRSPTALVDVFDRWGKTPLQDASENGHEAVATFLRAHGATVKSAKAAKLLCTAAAAGNIDRLVRLLAEGSDINVSDYDGRTALHLAASEGHAPAVRWLLLHGANAKALDRFGGSPLDDSYREDRHEVRQILQQSSAHTAGRASIASVAPQQQAEEAPVVRSASAPLPPQLPPPDESPPVPVCRAPHVMSDSS